MRRVAVLVLALLGVVFSGCVAPEDLPEDVPGDLEQVVDLGSGEIVIARPDAGVEDVGPSLERPPVWRLGQWWTYRIHETIDGSDFEVRSVVAGAERDWFLLGMRRDVFSNDAMVLHLPGLGQVSRASLGFEMHDFMFDPLKFPLVVGGSWSTSWMGQPLEAEVLVAEGSLALVELVGPNIRINVTYDAVLGAISRLEAPGYATMEVVGSGFDHEGIVTVPHQHDLVFFHGRIAGGLDISLQPAPPVEVVTVPEGYDRVSFAIIFGNIAGDGVYREHVVAPDGSEYEASMTPADSQAFRLHLFENDAPAGDWQFTHTSGGAGFAAVEGIAYHVFDVTLPSGCILPSEGQHVHGDHAGDCAS